MRQSLIDQFLEYMDDPEAWKIIPELNRKLKDEEIKIIKRIMSGKSGKKSSLEYMPLINYFTGDVMKEPLYKEKKAEKWKKISNSEINLIKKLMKNIRETPKYIIKKKKDDEDLWNAEEAVKKGYIPMPKLNPPKSDISYSLIGRLVEIPNKSNLLLERYNRCIKAIKKERKKNDLPKIDPDELLPPGPNPELIGQYPKLIIDISKNEILKKVKISKASINGIFLALSYENKSIVDIFELPFLIHKQTIELDQSPTYIRWNPSHLYSCLAISNDNILTIALIKVGNVNAINSTLSNLKLENNNTVTNWEVISNEKLILRHNSKIKSFCWHNKGVYISVVLEKNQSNPIHIVHNWVKKITSTPFKFDSFTTNITSFHPNLPLIFSISPVTVSCYDLSKKVLSFRIFTSKKKFNTFSHTLEDYNFIVGTISGNLAWYNPYESKKPLKSVKISMKPIKTLISHPSIFIFCSISGSKASIFYYNPKLLNHLIFPLSTFKLSSSPIDAFFSSNEPSIYIVQRRKISILI